MSKTENKPSVEAAADSCSFRTSRSHLSPAQPGHSAALDCACAYTHMPVRRGLGERGAT